MKKLLYILMLLMLTSCVSIDKGVTIHLAQVSESSSITAKVDLDDGGIFYNIKF